jgi:crotonobetainyl-CoA:carnitine CoA-transferase CaiB-like acyl-CoA transferase
LHAVLSGAFAARTRDEWVAVLHAHDVPCAPVLPRSEVFQQPQFWENGYLVQIDRPGGRMVECVGPPLQLSQQPASIRRPPPRLGEHTQEVLEELDYSPKRIRSLWDAGVIRPLQ